MREMETPAETLKRHMAKLDESEPGIESLSLVSGVTKALFWSRVATGEREKCWNWTAGLNSKGYGQFHVPDRGGILAHRFSFLVTFGDLPVGTHVLHKCDNSICVNPFHLFTGTQRDNNRDMKNKNRHAHGETNARSKLSEEQVRIVIDRCAKGEKQRDVARDFGITQPAVSYIIQGKNWAHLAR